MYCNNRKCSNTSSLDCYSVCILYANQYIYVFFNVAAWEFYDDWISMCTVFVCLIKYYLNVLNLTNIEGNHYKYCIILLITIFSNTF